MKKTIMNFIKKLATSAMLFAFLFNANFTLIESAHAQWNDSDWTTQDPSNYTYNTDSYTNPNIDYVTYGCEYYGNCANNNTVGNSTWNDSDWTTQNPSTYVYNTDSYTNPNIDYITYGCEYYGSCNTTYPQEPVYPTYPQQPVYPTNPVYPVYPTQPVYPVQPAYPVSPVYPVQPVNPVYPVSPVTPITYTYYCNINGVTYYSQAEYNYGCRNTITPIQPQPTYYCAINGQTYNSQSAYDIGCRAPVISLYCSINGQTYNSQEAYNANCVNRPSLYCALNGQTYTSQQAYADGCRKYCALNTYYYSTQSEYDAYCRTPIVNLYCALNGQTYNSQSAYDAGCRNVNPTYYCSINGQTYNNINDYNNYCKNPTISLYCALNGNTYNSQDAYNTGCRLYCTYNGYYYNTQNEYNVSCKAPISLYCALNGSTYSSNESYAAGCKKYCSINGFYYGTQNEYDNYCKAPVTPVWYCTVNSRTYYSQNDYNNNCRNIIVNNHRVVTTIPTQITKTSARCNGVAMIVNNVNTTGYFEYGASANLGYTTNSGNIGNQMSTQYSNLINGLKSNTTYYCRAVITNINGTYKGELMSFKTATEHVQYIPIVTAPKPKQVITYVKQNKVTKKVVTYVAPKTDKGGVDITCKDIEGNQSVIKNGQKLAIVNFDKVSGEVIKGGIIDYKLSYKNTSDLTLSNVIVKVTAPKDMTFLDKNIGEYNAIENSITIEDARVKSGETVEKIIKMQVSDTVTAGKSLIVNSYLSYEVLDTKGSILKDEVTNYSVVTVANDVKVTANNTKVDTKNTTTGSILPGTVLEWIAVIALFMILFILGRVIFKDIMGTKSEVNHH